MSAQCRFFCSVLAMALAWLFAGTARAQGYGFGNHSGFAGHGSGTPPAFAHSASSYPGFGSPHSGLGSPQPGFGSPQPGFGSPHSGFGSPHPGFGSSSSWQSNSGFANQSPPASHPHHTGFSEYAHHSGLPIYPYRSSGSTFYGHVGYNQYIPDINTYHGEDEPLPLMIPEVPPLQQLMISPPPPSNVTARHLTTPVKQLDWELFSPQELAALSTLPFAPLKKTDPPLNLAFAHIEDQLVRLHDQGRIGSMDIDLFSEQLLSLKRNYSVMLSSKGTLSSRQEEVLRNDLCSLNERINHQTRNN